MRRIVEEEFRNVRVGASADEDRQCFKNAIVRADLQIDRKDKVKRETWASNELVKVSAHKQVAWREYDTAKNELEKKLLRNVIKVWRAKKEECEGCLLYTSDAADE